MIEADQLAPIEAIVDKSGVVNRIEALLPVGVRPRRLSVRTLIIAILIALADHCPAHLTRFYEALVNLSEPDKWRLGVISDWHAVPHQLTYRQAGYTFGLLVNGLGKKLLQEKTMSYSNFPELRERVSVLGSNRRGLDQTRITSTPGMAS